MKKSKKKLAVLADTLAVIRAGSDVHLRWNKSSTKQICKRVVIAIFCVAYLISTGSVNVLADSALPPFVDVNLFAAQTSHDQLQILAPFVVSASESSATYSAHSGVANLRKIGHSIELLMSAQPGGHAESLHLQAHALTFQGAQGARLTIICGGEKRSYRGTIKITTVDKAPNMVLVNHVGRRLYIEGVCAAEMPLEAPLEALKVQAVLANTVLAAKRGRTALDDTTQDQAYIGVPVGRPSITEAVRSIGNQILLYNDQPVKPLFHSTCGGRTSNVEDIFGYSKKSYPYLRSVECNFCGQSPFRKATETAVPYSKYAKVFGNGLPRVEKSDQASRPVEISLPDKSGSDVADVGTSAYQFWLHIGQHFGWDKVPGNKFSWKREGDYVRFRSEGAGHGVGLCQWGAIGMAKQHKDYKQILAYYFKYATLSVDSAAHIPGGKPEPR